MLQLSIKDKYYYMACSVSGQDEPNPVLWLATRAGKMELSCLLGIKCRVPHKTFPQKPYNKSFLDLACSAKMTFLFFFCLVLFFCKFMDLDSVLVHKHAKNEIGQYPAILTSHLVNNPYVLHELSVRKNSLKRTPCWSNCCKKPKKDNTLWNVTWNAGIELTTISIGNNLQETFKGISQ